MMKALLLTTVISLFMINCKKDNYNDDKLSLEKRDYYGDELRIDGYYYHEYSTSGSDTYIDIYFLFRKGVILYGDSFKKSKLSQKEKEYQTIEWQDYAKKLKSSWGVFIIEDNSIKFERWYPSEVPLRAYIRAGKILTDTTFLITESYRMKDGKRTEVRERNETYKFRQFSPKPDSTNNFIK